MQSVLLSPNLCDGVLLSKMDDALLMLLVRWVQRFRGTFCFLFCPLLLCCFPSTKYLLCATSPSSSSYVYLHLVQYFFPLLFFVLFVLNCLNCHPHGIKYVHMQLSMSLQLASAHTHTSLLLLLSAHNISRMRKNNQKHENPLKHFQTQTFHVFHNFP